MTTLVPLAIALALLTLTASNLHAAGQPSRTRTAPMPPTTKGPNDWTWADWAPYVEEARDDLPAVFIRRWLEVEGINPCTIGAPGVKGPDGYPLELGPAQLYNPDDLVRYGITAAELRAYCDPGGGGRCVRRPTPAELRASVGAFLRKMRAVRIRARAKLAAVGAHWGFRDEYRMTKLVHGLPDLVNTGLGIVAHQLGRPPTDWAEFRQQVTATPWATTPGGATIARYWAQPSRHGNPNLVYDILDNAETTGGVVPDQVVT